MSKITRRNVLTGIAGFSLAAAVGCEKQAPQPQKNAKLTDRVPLTKLNVLVHGLSIIVINQGPAEKGINIFMPSFVADNAAMSHQYLFGNLVYTQQQELDQIKPLGPGDICTLSGFTKPGTKPSPSSFNPAINLVFPNAPVNCNKWCRQFNLPWTDQIQTIGLIYRDDNKKLMTDTNCSTTYGNTPKLSSICAFSYVFKEDDILKITYDVDGSDTGWKPQQQTGDPNYPGYANLHIFAEPKQADSDHAVKGFKLLMGDIGKGCLDFDSIPQGTKMIQDPDNPPPKGTNQDFDLKHLDSFKGGELANCVSAIVFQ